MTTPLDGLTIEFRSPVTTIQWRNGSKTPLTFEPVWQRRLQAIWTFLTTFVPGPSYIATETGIANAIACAANSGPALADGLTVTIKLANALHAGANTFAYKGGPAIPIKSHFNPANNIATAYVAGSYVTLVYSLGANLWQDCSQ
jgi:hypothetical protein